MNQFEYRVFQKWLGSLLEQDFDIENKTLRIVEATQFVLSGGLGTEKNKLSSRS